MIYRENPITSERESVRGIGFAGVIRSIRRDLGGGVLQEAEASAPNR